MIETFTACSFCLRMPIDRNLGSDSILKAKGAEEEEKDYLSFLRIQQIAIDLISGQADVYFLQGLTKHGKDFIQPFLDRNFAVIRVNSETFETAIAINPERFAIIYNLSINILLKSGDRTDLAIAYVRNKKNNQELCFSSFSIEYKKYFSLFEEIDKAKRGKGDYVRTNHQTVAGTNRDNGIFIRYDDNFFGSTFFTEYIISQVNINSEDCVSSCLKKFSSECQPTFGGIKTRETPSRLSGLFQNAFKSEPKTKEE
ncbi:MAG: hypothetical protein K940chlam5_00643 [Candidatus Anoxychlamydiales bacterium]|nr:hypothetical protein [Candidatus Anoxychlamydiales bacterium]